MAATPKALREPRKCHVCPHVFTPSRNDQIYCGPACRSRATAYRLSPAAAARR